MISEKELSKNWRHRLAKVLSIIIYLLIFSFIILLNGWTIAGMLYGMLYVIIIGFILNILYYEGVLYIVKGKYGNSIVRRMIKFCKSNYGLVKNAIMRLKSNIQPVLSYIMILVLVLVLVGIGYKISYHVGLLNMNNEHDVSYEATLHKDITPTYDKIANFKDSCIFLFKNSSYYEDDTFINVLYYNPKTNSCFIYDEAWNDFVNMDGKSIGYQNIYFSEKLMESIWGY